MKIAIGSDHRGFDVRRRLRASLEQRGHEVVDHGPTTEAPCDYPDLAFAVARDVSEGRAERGILVCGSGVGMTIAANKVAGVRAALCYDEYAAEMCRRHNDGNVLCLAADRIGEGDVDELVRLFLETEFEGGRHARRIDKIIAFERTHCSG